MGAVDGVVVGISVGTGEGTDVGTGDGCFVGLEDGSEVVVGNVVGAFEDRK